ncbi:MAG TPA: hypothetical protein VM681_00675 [Candidatus Thermoplasmatota archaeon]|nr:hypothetical protein [Candidatus Thermoplasmatota archaeon]
MTSTLRACLRCGSADVNMPSVGAGDAFIPGTEDVMGTVVCGRCGYKAMPLSFDTEEALLAYRGEREREGWEEWKVPAGGGMTALPRADALPEHARFVSAVLMVGGLFLLALGALVMFTGTRGFAGWTLGVPPVLLGLALAVIGYHIHKNRDAPDVREMV